MSYEKNMEKLEAVVEKLENKNTTVDEGLELFNQAIKLAKTCVEELKAGKGKLELLTKELETINLDFDAERG